MSHEGAPEGARAGGQEGDRPSRRSFAAPAVAGIVAAVASALAASLQIWRLPVWASVAITFIAAMLAGVLAWATADPRREARRVPDGERVPPPAELPPVIAHFTGRAELLDEMRR